MSSIVERDVTEIRQTHEKVQRYFVFAIPGALWCIGELTCGGVAEGLIHGTMSPTQGLVIALAFTACMIPFELSEHNMSKMKQHIRDYYHRSGKTTPPITYTRVDRFVNTVMKFAFDKSPLP